MLKDTPCALRPIGSESVSERTMGEFLCNKDAECWYIYAHGKQAFS